jgi:hypothetical protein
MKQKLIKNQFLKVLQNKSKKNQETEALKLNQRAKTNLKKLNQKVIKKKMFNKKKVPQNL